MRKIVVTLCIGDDYERLSRLTHPSMIQYANKINADFYVIDKDICNNIYFSKFDLNRILEDYDRAIFVDTDCFINKKCPDLFDLVPFDSVGIYDELVFPNWYLGESLYWVNECYDKYGFKFLKNEDDIYHYNTGVMVVSNIHKDLFILPETILKLDGDFGEQSYLNCRLIELNYKIFDIGYKFNRNLFLNAFIREKYYDSYIIHYYNTDNKEREKLINKNLVMGRI
jgi:hypothetical protein